MTTLRFGMTAIASRALSMEAAVRVMTEYFGRKPNVVSELSEKSCDVKLSKQIKQLQNETSQAIDWVLSQLIPIAGSYQALLLDRVKQIPGLYPPEEAEAIMNHDNYEIEEITSHINEIRQTVAEITLQCKAANVLTDERSIFLAYTNNISTYMEKLRVHSDKLRNIAGSARN